MPTKPGPPSAAELAHLALADATTADPRSTQPRGAGALASAPWDALAREDAAGRFGEAASTAIVGVERLAARAREAADPVAAQQWANAARHLAVAAGILTDKAQLLTGGATSRSERIDAKVLADRLNRVLDATATERGGKCSSES